MLLCAVLVIQSARDPERLPKIFGYKALIMLPDKADGDRDLGIIHVVDPASFREHDPVVHRDANAIYIEPVRRINVSGNEMILQTGPANGAGALTQVNAKQIEGLLVRRIPKAGGWLLYLQTPSGVLFFMFLPVLIFLAMNILGRRHSVEPAPDRASDNFIQL